MKTSFPIEVTDDGIEICLNNEHRLKEFSPIEVTDDESSNATCVSDEQSMKTLFPIEVTDDGIVICFNDEQFLKEFSPIGVTDDGIVICSIFSLNLNKSSVIIL